MAFYAEMKRRQWYCVCGVNMVDWYSDFLYKEWWNSLTDEQRERIIARRKERKERRAKEAEAAISRLLCMSTMVAGMANRASARSRDKYSQVYDEFGFPKIQ